MNYSIADLSAKLAERVDEVCLRLLPGGKRNGALWEAGDTTGAPGSSCKVNLDGSYRGHWKDWASDTDRGDLVDLWQSVRGQTRLEALKEIKEFLGVADLYQPRPKKYAAPKDSEKIKQIADNGKVMNHLTGDRKLEPAIINRFKIQGDGESIIYPSYSQDGKLINRTFIGFNRTPEGKKVVRQEKGCAPSLWGWQGLDESAIKDRKILLCEGQIDCMTWTQWGVPALSIPNGTGATWIEYEWESLELFSEIFLSFDMDGAGEENLKKVMNRIGLHRCRIIRLPYKDANDALKNGATALQARQWVDSAEYPHFEGLSPASKFKNDVYEDFYPDPNKPQGLKHPALQRFDGGIRFMPGDVTVWTGVSSHGKSTLLNWLTIHAIIVGQKALMASFEMRPGKLVANMFRAMLNKPFLTPKEIEDSQGDIEGRLFFVDKMGCINRKELLEMMWFAYSRHGIEHFVIDSLMRINGLEEDYPAQGDFFNDLQGFTKKSGGHVHIVCHPRKTEKESMPGKLDIKGSSLIMNNCDNIIAIHKNMEKDAIRRERQVTDLEDMEMHDTEVVSEKQRDGGWHGIIRLRYSPKTTNFSKFP